MLPQRDPRQDNRQARVQGCSQDVRHAGGRVPRAIEDRLYCPHADCGVYVPRSAVLLASRIARCSNGHQTCTICRQPAHGRASCPQDVELRLTENLALEEGWRRCVRCGVLIEHRDACQHMTCRCGAEFCYVCGGIWRSCACSMDDLHALKARVQHRRQERDAEAAREEVELREALRQIEEFEREEARKAELLRLEQERLEREQHRRDLEARGRREEERRAAVADLFSHERVELDALAREQDAILKYTHHGSRTALADEAAATRAQLECRLASQRGGAAVDDAAAHQGGASSRGTVTTARGWPWSAR